MKINKIIARLLVLLTVFSPRVHAGERQVIQALYMPLADHYAALVAYERYRDRMTHADFRLRQMRSWPQLRGSFRDDEAELAFIISPMAMDMFRQQPDFRWVSLMHRNGNALAINAQLLRDTPLPKDRKDRLPDNSVALAMKRARKSLGHASVVAVPSLLSTHAVALYKYLRDHHLKLSLGRHRDHAVVMAVEVPPSQSIDFLRRENERGVPASLEQSLPWADSVETSGAGRVGWYSKDVLKWPEGHVECIAIASDRSIRDKTAALREVIAFIHQAAADIEHARTAGGPEMQEIVGLIQRHLPQHGSEAIVQSLRTDIDAINYRHLDTDRPGLQMIMELAVEAGILQQPIDLDAFTDPGFGTTGTPHAATVDGDPRNPEEKHPRTAQTTRRSP
ncbi:MAG: ABC transporter substrate-binding protein [Magnetococcales bacterium]|nr:ABC transporter substrate-binding protein [Magnetococcales bacterium]